MMHLYIGNKLYSSWSLRPWIAMRALGIEFEETLIPFTDPDFKTRALAVSQAGLLPVLVDGDVTVWESLAILEYLADKYPEKRVWPMDPGARAFARSISAEMHSGFSAVRSACPMNLGKRYSNRDRGADVARNVERICAVIGEARSRFGERGDGPFLFGAFTAADAMYAPLMTRLDTYAIAVDDVTRGYVGAILAMPAFQDWRIAALREPWIFDDDEVDEPALENFRQQITD